MSAFDQEPFLAILVVDGKLRYANERLTRDAGETDTAFADRVRTAILEMIAQRPAPPR